MRKPATPLLLVPLALCVLGVPASALPPDARGVAAAQARLPLAFEENRGQSDPAVRFLARLPGRLAFLEDDGVWLSAPDGGDGAAPGAAEPFGISLVGAESSRPSGERRLPGATNYLIGDDPSQWRRGVPGFSRVRYPGVYPGIDLVYYGNAGRLEFDFEVASGADPGRIRLSLGGAAAATLEPNGDLCLAAGSEERRLRAPDVYQTVGQERRRIAARYALFSAGDGSTVPTVGFRVGPHDPSSPLVIDPVLLYSTYLGGSDYDEVDAIAVDPEGNAYVTGRTYSTNFPATAGVPQHSYGGNEDTYVTKINASGTAIVYSTYLGGSDRDFGNAIAVDALGQAVVGGRTISANFPGAASSPIQNAKRGEDDGFVARLDATGSNVLFSTYLGGSSTEKVEALALDPDGNILVAGQTDSANFPGTAGNAFGSAYKGNSDGFVAKLDSGGFSLLYAAYLGGSGIEGASAIASDRRGNAYVAGGTESSNFTGTESSPIQKTLRGSSDGYLVKIDRRGTRIVFATYLGGSADDFADAVKIDPDGDAVVAGYTQSTDFPGTSGGFQPTNHGNTDAFVAKFDALGSAIVSATYLGGSGEDYVDALGLDALGGVYIAGYTESSNFPGAAGSAIQPSYGGQGDGFVARLAPDLRALAYSTYLGGSGNDEAYAIAVHANSAHVGGVTLSTNFPGASASPIQNVPHGDYEGFVVRISAVDPPLRSIVPVVPPVPALVER